jgi:type I restriction enzyme R subunit
LEKLHEVHVENAAIEWLQKMGYVYQHGASIARDARSVVLEDELMQFIAKTYPTLPADMVKEAAKEFTNNAGADLDYRNRDFHLKLTKGIDISWKDTTGKESALHVYPIDFENPQNNTFTCVNQLEIIGRNRRIPDLLIYINGLPLIIFEFKNWFDYNTTENEAYNQIQHYKQDIPLLFEYNALTIISDGKTAQHGMFPASMEWYSPWKSINGKDIVDANDFQLNTLLHGLFVKERLINYLKYFIFFEDHNGTLIKKGAKYHQYFGVNFAVEKTKQAIKPIGDGRIGVIWHTQGSGKSISMAIYTGMLRQLPELKNPTVIIQVDRNDLDWQLYENFVLCKDIVGTVQHATSTDELRRLLDTDAGGVIFTTIEKFRLKKDDGEIAHPILSKRDNIIVIADEAHRTQYGLLDGYAANLRTALPNASFIGFTGTPVDSKQADTEELFGEVIHTYDIKQAVEDGATVPIYYEPRLAKLHLANDNIDEEVDELQEAQGDQQSLKWAAIEDAAGSLDRVSKIATDIISHFTKRTGTLEGKAMVVCMSRKNCVKMYDALKQIEGCPEIAVIITANISKDPPEWKDHIRTKDQFEAIKKRFKNPDDPLKIVIVRDMWLTGFDAPIINTMYVDKVMTGHNLMQAIARANRVFADKQSGVIVDYIGIGDQLKTATMKYTAGGGRGDTKIDIEQALEMFYNQVEKCKAHLPEEINYQQWKALTTGDKMMLINQGANAILKTDQLAEEFMQDEKKLTGLVSIVKSREELTEFALDVIYVQHVSAVVRKAKSIIVGKKDNQKKVRDLISQSIESEDIIDVFAMAGIARPDVSILNEEFLLGAKKDKTGLALKIELMRNILKGEIALRLRKNIKKYTSLKEEIEKVIDLYHKNAIDSYTTILELVERAKDMQEEEKRQKELLDTQFRMPISLGKMVSKFVYNQELKSEEGMCGATHTITNFGPLVFVDTSTSPLRFSKQNGHSHSNAFNTKTIFNLLQYIDQFDEVKDYTIGIITGYLSQVSELEKLLRGKTFKNIKVPDDFRKANEKELVISTVDKFQGSEKDIIIFDVVKSEVNGSLGFLAMPNRINVAFSRAQRLMIAVGDTDFIENTPSKTGQKVLLQEFTKYMLDNAQVINAEEIEKLKP